jgi:hypothetical protein
MGCIRCVLIVDVLKPLVRGRERKTEEKRDGEEEKTKPNGGGISNYTQPGGRLETLEYNLPQCNEGKDGRGLRVSECKDRERAASFPWGRARELRQEPYALGWSREFVRPAGKGCFLSVLGLQTSPKHWVNVPM